MRWIGLFLLVACLGIIACESPTVPKYPKPDDDTPGEDDPPKGGFLQEGMEVYWV